MSAEIKVDYAALEKMATHFGRESIVISQLLQKVQRALRPLQNDGWIGLSAEKFVDEMEQDLLPGVRRLGNALTEASRATKQISEIMRGAEQEAAVGFRSNSGAGRMSASDGSREGLDSAPSAVPDNLSENTTRTSEATDSTTLDDSRVNSALSNSRDGGGAVFGADGIGLDDGTGTGNMLDNNFFGGDFSGASADSLNGAAEDYGIEQDWLAGVGDSLQAYMQDNYDDYGIPQDWLSGVQKAMDQTGADSMAGIAESTSEGKSAGDSGASSGGGGQSGGEQSSTESGAPQGMAGDGGSPTPSAVGVAEREQADATDSQPARLLYQSLGGMGGGGRDRQSPGLSGFGGPAAAPSPTTAEQSNLGLPLALAAVSSFVPLIGKALKKKTGEQ